MLVYGKNAILEALQNTQSVQKVFFSKDIHLSGVASKIFQLVKQNKIPYYKVPRKYLDKITNFSLHQGVVAYLSDYKYSSLEEILSEKKSVFLLILDEVQDTQNLGAILRVAEVAGISGVIIPKRRSAKITDVVFKTSAGAANLVKVCCVSNIANTILDLQKKDIQVIGLDIDGKNIFDVDISHKNIALVAGGEDKGITEHIKSKCDMVVKIPVFGKITSLNVSCAVAVATFEILRKKKFSGGERDGKHTC